MTYTTLNKIRSNSPCADGWAKLLKHLGKTKADDEPLALGVILDSNGLDDALWCLRTIDGHNQEKRLFAVSCARRVQYLLADQRLIAALDIAERHAKGEATDEELSAAHAAAWDAGDAARDAAVAAAAARAAARASAWAMRAAAWAARDAACEAAWVAGWAAGAAVDAVGAADAAEDAGAAEIDWQIAEFRRVFCNEEVTA